MGTGGFRRSMYPSHFVLCVLDASYWLPIESVAGAQLPERQALVAVGGH